MPSLDELEAEADRELQASPSLLDQLEQEADAELAGMPPTVSTNRMTPMDGPYQPTVGEDFDQALNQGGVLNVAQALARHLRDPMTGIGMADVGTGVDQARNDILTLGARLSGDSRMARQAERDSEIAGAEADQINSGVLSNAARGTVRSLIPMGITAGLGVAAPIAMGAGIRGAQAVSEAEDAGLTGAEAAGYVTRAASIEALPALVFQRLGLGGVEKTLADAWKGAASNGVKQALAHAGKSTVMQELPEEYLTAAADIANQKLSKVDPTTLTAEQVATTFRDVTLQTLMMGSAANLPAIAQGVAHDRQRARDEDRELSSLALGQLNPDLATNGQEPAPTQQDTPLAVTPEIIQAAQSLPEILRLFGVRGVADQAQDEQVRDAAINEQNQAELVNTQRKREMNAIGDEAVSASIDRKRGEDSIRKSDDEALRQQEIAALVDWAIGPKNRDPNANTEITGRAPDTKPINEELDRYRAGVAAANQVEAEYQTEVAAIDQRRQAPKAERIGKAQAAQLKDEAKIKRDQRMDEAITAAVRGQSVAAATLSDIQPAPPPTNTQDIPQVAPESAPRFDGITNNRADQPGDGATPSVLTQSNEPTIQEQDEAVKELERIVSEVASRTGSVSEMAALLPHLGPLGYRVDKAHALPAGAQRKRLALEAAAKARGVSLSDVAKQAQERAVAARPKATTAKVPLMITKRMTNELRGLGYWTEDIDKMTPPEANTILENRTMATPKSSMSTKAAQALSDEDFVPFSGDSSSDNASDDADFLRSQLRERDRLALSVDEAATAIRSIYENNEDATVVFPINNQVREQLVDLGVSLKPVAAHRIDLSRLRHAMNKHGGADEVKRGQVPLTSDDLAQIPAVLDQPDDIVPTGDGFDFIKRSADGSMIVTEVRSGKQSGMLMVTAYKHQNPAHKAGSGIKRSRLTQSDARSSEQNVQDEGRMPLDGESVTEPRNRGKRDEGTGDQNGVQYGRLPLPGEEFSNQDLIKEDRKAKGEKAPAGRKPYSQLEQESFEAERGQHARKAVARAWSTDGKPGLRLSKISMEKSGTGALSGADSLAVFDPLLSTVQIAHDLTAKEAAVVGKRLQGMEGADLSGKSVMVEVDGRSVSFPAKKAVDIVSRRLQGLQAIFNCLGGK